MQWHWGRSGLAFTPAPVPVRRTGAGGAPGRSRRAPRSRGVAAAVVVDNRCSGVDVPGDDRGRIGSVMGYLAGGQLVAGQVPAPVRAPVELPRRLGAGRERVDPDSGMHARRAHAVLLARAAGRGWARAG